MKNNNYTKEREEIFKLMKNVQNLNNQISNFQHKMRTTELNDIAAMRELRMQVDSLYLLNSSLGELYGFTLASDICDSRI